MSFSDYLYGNHKLMRKFSRPTLVISALFFLLSCSKESGDNPVDIQFVFDAVGTVSEQTVEEAKKTINGKWDVSNAPSSSKRNVSCTFLGIEFTDTRFALGFSIQGGNPDTGESINEEIFAYGAYVLNEGSDGTVTSVDLFQTIDGVDLKIAQLVDIIVEESDTDLNATFSIEFDLPNDFFDFPCGTLSGDYSAEKDEPVVTETEGNANSVFAKLVNVWSLTSIELDGVQEDVALLVVEDFVEDDLCEDIYDTLFDFEQLDEQVNAFEEQFEADQTTFIAENPNATEDDYNAFLNTYFEALEALYASFEPSEADFEEAEEECERITREYSQTIDASVEVSFSAYGSYIFTIMINGDTVEVNVDDWEFANTEQTELLVDGGEARLQIETITDTQLVIVETVDASQDLDNEDEDELPIKWYFTKVN